MKRVGLIVGVFVAMGLVIVGLNMMTKKKTPTTPTTPTTQNNTSQTSTSSSDTNNSSPKQQSNVVNITSSGFSPQTLTVPVGTTVVWVNHDTAKHTVTGDIRSDDASGPGSTSLATNASYLFTFTTAGTYTYSSISDADFTGTVTVTQ